MDTTATRQNIETTLSELIMAVSEECDSHEELIATLKHIFATHQVTARTDHSALLKLAA